MEKLGLGTTSSELSTNKLLASFFNLDKNLASLLLIHSALPDEESDDDSGEEDEEEEEEESSSSDSGISGALSKGKINNTNNIPPISLPPLDVPIPSTTPPPPTDILPSTPLSPSSSSLCPYPHTTPTPSPRPQTLTPEELAEQQLQRIFQEMYTPQELQRLTKLFGQYDRENNGSITVDQMQQLTCEDMGLQNTNDENDLELDVIIAASFESTEQEPPYISLNHFLLGYQRFSRAVKKKIQLRNQTRELLLKRREQEEIERIEKERRRDLEREQEREREKERAKEKDNEKLEGKDILKATQNEKEIQAILQGINKVIDISKSIMNNTSN